ncbi:MAG: hypothetical protein WDN04_04775 [Rhodospirillales bacterium]
MNIISLAAALALAVTVAHAKGGRTLATAPIYGGPTAVSEICFVTNYSSAAVQLGSVAVKDNTGQGSLTATANSCAGPIASGGSCRYTVAIPQPPSAAYFCEVTAKVTAAIAADLRLTNEALDVNATGLSNEPGK